MTPTVNTDDRSFFMPFSAWFSFGSFYFQKEKEPPQDSSHGGFILLIANS